MHQAQRELSTKHMRASKDLDIMTASRDEGVVKIDELSEEVTNLNKELIQKIS